MTRAPRHRQPRRWPLPAAVAGALTVLVVVLSILALPGLDGRPSSRLALGKGPGNAGAAPARKPPTAPTSTASPSPVVTTGFTETTQTVTIAGLARTYVTFLPVHPVAARIPALVVLHGLGVTPDQEAGRDGLIPLAFGGDAELIYPAGFQQSWDGGSCCGPAQTAGIDDVSFVATLLHQTQADPALSGSYLVGYSNGGKVAFRVACADPSLLTALISIHAVPGTACQVGAPVSLLMVAATKDPRVTYDSTTPAHVVGGFKEATVTAQVTAWRSLDACDGTPVRQTSGELTAQTWRCSAATRVELATYTGGDHTWPVGGNGTPSAAEVIWAFVTSGP
ncbi:MAG: polyhydroxybutyrate depolymerase [Actinomycetota bacterium]|nr:polyhydroxybutyrate depolymerase [Actinomycetota bacterium]